MSEPSYKVLVDFNATDESVRFSDAKVVVALDSSGSTLGKIWKREVEALMKFPNHVMECRAASWSYHCKDTILVRNDKKPNISFLNSGTMPVSIIENTHVLEDIKKAHCWVLFTDGHIAADDVRAFARQLSVTKITAKPFIFVNYGLAKNISVGIACWASVSDGMLVNENGDGSFTVTHVKGLFETVAKETYQSFNELLQAIEKVKLPNSNIEDAAIKLPGAWNEKNPNTKVDVPMMIDIEKTTVTDEELELLVDTDTFHSIALYCKTNNLLSTLLRWLKLHEKNHQNVSFEDVANAHQFLEKLHKCNDESVKVQLRGQLRDANRINAQHHKQNMEAKKNSKSYQLMVKIRDAIATCSEMEKSGFTADILERKSNRAMRASTISNDDYVIAPDTSDTNMIAFKGRCDICYGDDAVMSFTLKKVPDEKSENTTSDFALNYPMTQGSELYVHECLSAQHLCFDCARMSATTIYREEIVAVIPLVDCASLPNRRYIMHGLTKSLTNGLQTGVSGIGQMFVSMLLHHISKETPWLDIAAAEWFVSTLLRNLPCRRDFTIQSEWTTLPSALTWALTDFEERGYESWLMAYPATGYQCLLQCYKRLGIHVPRQVQFVRLVRSIVYAFCNSMKNQTSPAEWLTTLYHSFYYQGVPVERTILLDRKEFIDKLSKIVPTIVEYDISAVEQYALQIFIYVMIQEGSRNVTVTLNQRIKHLLEQAYNKHLVSKILENPERMFDDMTEEAMIRSVTTILHEPFTNTTRNFVTQDGVLFVSPFGPSVLKGVQPDGNDVDFTTELSNEDITFLNEQRGNSKADYTSKKWWIVRTKLFNARDKFLKATYYDASAQKVSSISGLPMRLEVDETHMNLPKPTSKHCNLHQSIIRVWMHATVEERMKMVKSVLANEKAIAFQQKAVEEIATSHRGDIYASDLEHDIGIVLPSYVKSIQAYVKSENVNDICAFQYSATDTMLCHKILYEWSLRSAN